MSQSVALLSNDIVVKPDEQFEMAIELMNSHLFCFLGISFNLDFQFRTVNDYTNHFRFWIRRITRV